MVRSTRTSSSTTSRIRFSARVTGLSRTTRLVVRSFPCCGTPCACRGGRPRNPLVSPDPKSGECSPPIFAASRRRTTRPCPIPDSRDSVSIAQARRINDAELVKAAANVEKKIDGFRSAYDSALADNTNITSETRQAAIRQVDSMKKYAQALNAALADKKEGVSEADALLKGTGASSRRRRSSRRVPQRRVVDAAARRPGNNRVGV